jgi:hypothetical protein
MKVPSFLSKLVVRFFAKSFFQKHISSVFTYLSGLITALAVVEPQLLSDWVSINAQVLGSIAFYFAGAWIDSKPETPELIKK